MKELKVFLMAAGLIATQVGCVVINLTELPEGKDVYELESVKFNWHATKVNSRGFMMANVIRSRGGKPVAGEETKLAFGLFPSCAQRDNFNIGFWGGAFLPPFMLGIPYVSSLFFEPFLEPLSKEESGIVTVRGPAPFGFHKYKIRNYVGDFNSGYSDYNCILSDYAFEFRGKRYNVDKTGYVNLPKIEKGEKVRIKIVSIPKAKSTVALQGLDMVSGMEIDVDVLYLGDTIWGKSSF